MNRVVDCENQCQRPEGHICTGNCKIAEELSNDSLREAVFTVLEGCTLPPAARKILETAYYGGN